AALRVELVEQAFALERQGRLDAADVAITVSNQLGELIEAKVEPGRRPGWLILKARPVCPP
ncbi:MAG TPA: hypothetical protein PLG56_10980, partial [Lacunisphaera sp.]|nr:hypothetical protein [Lacunisphaera sp.]